MTIINIPPGVSRSRLDDDLAALQTDIDGKVSKAGDTMTGDLTVGSRTNPIFIAKTSVKYGDARSSNKQIGGLRFQYANSTTNVGFVSMFHDTNTYMTHGIRHINASGNSVNYSAINIYANETEAYATAPTPPSTSDNTTKIATTAWVNSATTVVHRSGNETIAGVKTFEEVVRDPIRQFSFVCPPNSNAANAPYYCVAELDYTDMATWDACTMEMDVVPGWSGGDVRSMQIACRIQTGGATDGIPALGSYRLHCTGRRGIYNTLMDESRWTLAINTTTHIIQIWVKDEFNQTNLIASMTHNSRRNGEKGHWTLHRNPTGVVTLPSEDDGWTLVTCLDRSGYVRNFAYVIGNDPAIYMNHDEYTRGTNPSESKFWVWGRMRDTAGKDVMSLEGKIDSSGGRTFQLATIDDAGTWIYPLRITTASDGSEVQMTGISSPMLNSSGVRINDNRLITAKMLAGDSGVVHTTGNETISGIKTLTGRLFLNNSLRVQPTSPNTRRAVVFNKSTDGSELGWLGYPTDTGDMLINLINGDRVSINKSTPADATSNEIATANWVRARISESPTVIDCTFAGNVVSADLSGVTFRTANRLLEVHISARSDLSGGSAMYGQFTIPLAPEGNIGLASQYFDVPAGNGRFQITYSDSSTDTTAIFEIAVITSTGGDITDDCSIYPYAIAL